MKHLKTTILEDYISNRIFFLAVLLPVSLIPAFLVTGPFLPDLSISIAAIFSIKPKFEQTYNIFKSTTVFGT